MGDKSTTNTFGAAYGGGAEYQGASGSGDNDSVAITLLGLGTDASRTWGVVDITTNFSDQNPAPTYISILNSKDGAGFVLGSELRYYPPGQVELKISRGFGLSEKLHVFDVGANIEKLYQGAQ